MHFMKWNISQPLLLLHCAGLTMVNAIAPQIQTNVFKGVPDNWASNINIDPFLKIGQKYYYIETAHKVNWFEAAHECSKRNTNLASLESAGEFDELQKYLISKNWRMRLWTSGNDLAKEGQYCWLGTGNTIGYIRWNSGQPDNYQGEENCLHVELTADRTFFNDENCLTELEFICEAKTPTTVALTLW